MSRTLTDDDVNAIVSELEVRVRCNNDERLLPVDWDMQKRIMRMYAHAMGAEQEAKSCRVELSRIAAGRISAQDRDSIVAAVVDKIAERIIESGRLVSREILTGKEAALYVKRSPHSFSTWCKRWWIKPHERNRYSVSDRPGSSVVSIDGHSG